jgi:L-cysteine S-thiosulfotransferase
MKLRIATVAALLVFAATPVLAQETKLDTAKVDAAIKAAFPDINADFVSRLTPDQTMRECSASDNAPSQAVFEEIKKREQAKIKYPADGKLMGDWKKGEKLAQSGYGLRFSDYPARRANGGNCYGCHQLTKQEVSYGTVGPSLLGYGKIKEFSPAAVKAAYEKIYNGHAGAPCSLMPRFGTNGILTVEQIKDAVALVMSPDSPVNK